MLNVECVHPATNILLLKLIDNCRRAKQYFVTHTDGLTKSAGQELRTGFRF